MGTVNIFLGGTGKHIAEDIQDSRDFFDLQISEPVAFDLDAHVKDGVDLKAFVAPDGKAIGRVHDIAKEWAGLDPGRNLGPGDGAASPGPQLSPEHSVLVAVGNGILANPQIDSGLYALRAHGLTVFSVLFDDSQGMSEQGRDFINHVNSCIQNQTIDGVAPRINIITSTAGGTGAGTVIPLALWLKREYPDLPLNLIAVTPSAFGNVLKGAEVLEDRAAKGRSGTYALFRELSFLQDVDHRAEFSVRELPVIRHGLPYRPGQKIFSSVYWFGGRDVRTPDDAYEEAGALLRILSFDSTANQLDSHAGVSPLKMVGAVTAIEYPKLRIQRKLVSRVLVAAYDRLSAPQPAFVGGTALEGMASLLGYVDGNVGRTLGAWFSVQRFESLAVDAAPAPLDANGVRDLVDGIQQEAGVDGYDSVRRGGHYEDSDAAWKAYQGRLLANLDRISLANQQKLRVAIPKMRAGEETAFAEWLKGKVFDEWLSGDARGDGLLGVRDVQALLDRLDQNAKELEARVSQADFLPGDTVDHTNTRVNLGKNKLDKPDAEDASLSFWQRLLGYGAAIGVFFAFVLGLQPAWDSVSRFGEFAGTSVSEILVWLGGVILAILTERAVGWFFMRSRGNDASLRQRRIKAEDHLFATYALRDRVYALHWLHEELRGKDGATPFFRKLHEQVQSARAAVDQLGELYRGLGAEAAAEVAKADEPPAHIHATVGDHLGVDQKIVDDIVPAIERRIRVDATPGPEHSIGTLDVRLAPLPADAGKVTAVSADVADILRSLRPDQQVGQLVANQVAGNWRKAVWDLVNWQLGQNLPNTFGDALLVSNGNNPAAATRDLATMLNTLSLPRQRSVALRVPGATPLFRQVYAGDASILAELNRALGDGALDAATANHLGAYPQGNVVPSLGEQIVFLDLWADDGASKFWAPHIIGNAAEAEAAIATYYGETNAADTATALGMCFTVIPELLAATKLELGGNVEPLDPAVTARLLGSDPDTHGPTYAELFYLLRTRGRLVFGERGDGPQAQNVVRIDSPGGEESLDLVEYRAGGNADPRFGAGRHIIIAFDAFCEFMRFKGTPQVGAGGGLRPFTNATLQDAAWRNDRQRAARIQSTAIDEWWSRTNFDADSKDMLDMLESDLERMGNGDSEVRRSWKQAMERLLGDRRRKILN